MKPREPRIYKGTIYLLNAQGETQIRGFKCKGANKDEARKDAIAQAAKIWPLTRVAVGGLKWQKGKVA